jgi:AcrR family transcriptional regulator
MSHESARPPGPPPPESAANAKVAKILDAARRVFLEHGFGAATTDMIQREAGVSKSTVYAHFAAKDQLFAAVVQAECGCFMHSLVTEPMGPSDIRENLRQVGSHFLDLVLDPVALAFYRTIVAEAPRFPHLGQTFYASGPRRLTAMVARLLEEAGEVRVEDPAAAAEQFIGMLRGDRHLRCLLGIEVKPEPMEIRRIVDHAVDTFLRIHRAAA